MSFQGTWLGRVIGAWFGTVQATQPPPVIVTGGGGYEMPKRKRRPINDEEELMAIIQMALHVMGRRP